MQKQVTKTDYKGKEDGVSSAQLADGNCNSCKTCNLQPATGNN